jgi:hypothetical protein
MIDSDQIKCLADDNGWEVTMERPENRLVRVCKGKDKCMDIWYSTGTVGIHKGRTTRTRSGFIDSRYRKGLELEEITNLLKS